MAYVLGFFAADGNMIKNKRGGHFISFEITDRNLLEKIRDVLGSNHKIAMRKRRNSWKQSYSLQIGSKLMFNELLSLGLTAHKSKTIKLPKVPEKYFPDFLRGYFDGDGCAQLGRYWRKDRRKWKWQFTVNFTSGSKKFLEELWIALKPFVAGGRLGKKSRGYELIFSQKDGFALFDLMYDNVPAKMFLERKYDIFQKAFEVLKMRA